MKIKIRMLRGILRSPSNARLMLVGVMVALLLLVLASSRETMLLLLNSLMLYKPLDFGKN